jgi:DNA polymerase-3 subunit epsilon
VHVDPEAAFPRFVKTCDLSAATTTIAAAGRFIGPLEDKHAAQRLIELAEDSFDLCRYYNILVEAPNGRACAYKEMGKCPAPCDGSISLPQYRRLIEWAADTLVDPATEIARHTDRMKQAASALKFETASRIKQLIEQLAQLGKGPFRHARLLSDFSFVTLQRGPSQGQTKIFLITPGQIAPLLCQTDIPEHPADALRYLLNEAAARSNAPFDPAAAERIGIVAHHLFSPKSGHGAFIPLAEINEKSYLKAYKDVLKQKPAEETENEGVMKELQSME